MFFFALELSILKLLCLEYTAGQPPPTDPYDCLASEPLLLLVSELARAQRGRAYSLPRATEPQRRSTTATGAIGGSNEGR